MKISNNLRKKNALELHKGERGRGGRQKDDVKERTEGVKEKEMG